jgi:enamine deaminase RidA (YjgF/YER057c/UK114 family)
MIANGPRPVAPFSHAVESDGWIMLTGQMPTDPAAPDAPLPDGIEVIHSFILHVLSVNVAFFCCPRHSLDVY